MMLASAQHGSKRAVRHLFAEKSDTELTQAAIQPARVLEGWGECGREADWGRVKAAP